MNYFKLQSNPPDGGLRGVPAMKIDPSKKQPTSTIRIFNQNGNGGIY